MRIYRALLVASLFAMVLGLLAEAALSLGYGFEKWSANSRTLSIAIAIGIGLLVVAAVSFWACDMVAQFNAVAGDTQAGRLTR